MTTTLSLNLLFVVKHTLQLLRLIFRCCQRRRTQKTRSNDIARTFSFNILQWPPRASSDYLPTSERTSIVDQRSFIRRLGGLKECNFRMRSRSESQALLMLEMVELRGAMGCTPPTQLLMLGQHQPLGYACHPFLLSLSWFRSSSLMRLPSASRP